MGMFPLWSGVLLGGLTWHQSKTKGKPEEMKKKRETQTIMFNFGSIWLSTPFFQRKSILDRQSSFQTCSPH